VHGQGNIKNPEDKGDPKRRAGGGGNPPGQGNKSRAPEQTFEEVRYLKRLIENEIPVRVKLRDNSEVAGTIEYYDSSFIRLTRQNEPNLFVFKHEIKYIYEE
jgi:host factor-I protein